MHTQPLYNKIARTKAIVLSLVFCLLLNNCFVPEKETPVYSRDIVHISNQVIKEDYLRFRLKLELNKFPKDFFKSSEDKPVKENADMFAILQSVLNKIIEDEIILAYGKKNKINMEKEELDKRFEIQKKKYDKKALDNFLSENNITYNKWRRLIEKQIRVKYILENVFAKKLSVDMEQVQKYYKENIDSFKVDEQVRVRHIVTDSKEKAADILARLKKGENFAKLAVHHSISPERAIGGDLGYFSRGTFPKEFDDICFSLKKGDVSDVVKSSYGYHIFKILDQKPARIKSVLEVAGVIYETLFQEKLKTEFPIWLEEIKKETPPKIFEEHINTFVL